jgi:hypothetical protein
MEGDNGAAGNSRDSVAEAGWHCPPSDFAEAIPAGRRGHPFSWISPVPLWRSRNDVLARRLDDPTNDERRSWMERIHGNNLEPDLRVDRTDLESVSFAVLGDPGEGDASQYAVLPALSAFAHDTDFAVICSDVIYPAGGVNDYEDKFFRPYAGYPHPIYALPGNHDWYDNLTGFMFHFCGKAQPPEAGPAALFSKAGLRRLLWRRPPAPDPAEVAEMRELRGHPEQQAKLPGPYYLIDTGPLQLVCIDTGILGDIDRDQGVWLANVSEESEKPKILLTGKPIYVDGKHRPGTIEGGGTVDDIVRAPEHNYLAAIGGDIHNYQRYPVAVGGRVIQYLVSGGGGAFMHATHRIPLVDLPGVSEAEFRCYPLRGDSLSFYSQLYDKKLGFGAGRYLIPPSEAAAIMAERLKTGATKPEARGVAVSQRSRRAAERVFPLHGAHGPLQGVFSEFFDWNDPPLFKSFLRIDASMDEVRVRCFAATGCVGDAGRRPEDELSAKPRSSGEWHWS